MQRSDMNGREQGHGNYLLKLLEEDQGLLPCLRDVDPTRLDPRPLCRGNVILPRCRRLGGESRLLAFGSFQTRVPGRCEQV